MTSIPARRRLRPEPATKSFLPFHDQADQGVPVICQRPPNMASRKRISRAAPLTPICCQTSRDCHRRARRELTGADLTSAGCWRIHIKRVLNCQYGYPLPNDDAGSECFSLLCHAAFAGSPSEMIARDIRGTAELWADWATEAEIDALIAEVANRPRKLTKKRIGIELGLTKDVWQRVKAWSLWPIAYTNAEWQRDKAETARLRSARNRAAKRKPPTKKALCTEFLREVLAYGPAPVERILRIAISKGLEKPGAVGCSKPMRASREALGVVRRKMGLNGGWWWGLPMTAECPQTRRNPEDALSDAKSPYFIEDALSRSPTEEKNLLGERTASGDRKSVGDEEAAIGWAATLDGQCCGDGAGQVQSEVASSVPTLDARCRGDEVHADEETSLDGETSPHGQCHGEALVDEQNPPAWLLPGPAVPPPCEHGQLFNPSWTSPSPPPLGCRLTGWELPPVGPASIVLLMPHLRRQDSYGRVPIDQRWTLPLTGLRGGCAGGCRRDGGMRGDSRHHGSGRLMESGT